MTYPYDIQINVLEYKTYMKSIVPDNVYVWQISVRNSLRRYPKCYVTFSKTKMNVNWHPFYSKMSPQFWVTQYFRETNILKNQNAILICNKKNYESSVSILRSRMFLQMLTIVAQSIASTSSPQRETHIRASRVFKFNLSCKWLSIAFCLEISLSQTSIIDGMTAKVA